MDCAIFQLQKGLAYTLITPYGAQLKKGFVFIVPESKANDILKSNFKTLVKVGTMDIPGRLKFGSWELRKDTDKKLKPAPKAKKQTAKANKSMAGAKKTKNKKV